MGKSRMGLKVDLVNDIKSSYKGLKEEQKKKMGLVMRDLRRDVPSKVAKAVSKYYNIKSTEMKMPAVKVKVNKSGQQYKSRNAVSVDVKGDDIASMSIEYSGRRLTVQRFNMNPKKPVPFTGRPGNRKRVKKDITYKVFRGQQSIAKMDGHRTFVANVRGVYQAVYAKNGNRQIDKVATTFSVPTMVDNKKVRAEIHESINATVEKVLKRRMSD